MELHASQRVRDTRPQQPHKATSTRTSSSASLPGPLRLLHIGRATIPLLRLRQLRRGCTLSLVTHDSQRILRGHRTRRLPPTAAGVELSSHHPPHALLTLVLFAAFQSGCCATVVTPGRHVKYATLVGGPPHIKHSTSFSQIDPKHVYSTQGSLIVIIPDWPLRMGPLGPPPSHDSA